MATIKITCKGSTAANLEEATRCFNRALALEGEGKSVRMVSVMLNKAAAFENLALAS